MKLREEFITHKSAGEYIMVTTGNTAFNGIVKSNQTAGFIVECLEKGTTKSEIIEKMFEKYDAPREQIEQDVEKILKQLHSIGAIDD